jgi:hypothetical protein
VQTKLRANPDMHKARISGKVSNSLAVKGLTGLAGALFAEPYDMDVHLEELLDELFSDLLRHTIGDV